MASIRKKQRRKLIRIKPSKSYQRWAGSEGGACGERAWTKSCAFIANPRGVLIHRVRHVTTIIWDGVESHHHVDFLCGNGCNIETTDADAALVSDPPKDRLLCDKCEHRAAMMSLPNGDELAGRHVHRGVLIPQKVCCTET